jgi:hypothetical protein
LKTFVTFSLTPDGSIESARMAAVSPLADFSFDYQDLVLRAALKNVAIISRLPPWTRISAALT